MEFQFKSVYSRKDLASILYATEYLRWAQKPKTKRLWQLSHKAAPFVTLAGTAMFLLFSFNTKLAWAVVVVALVGMGVKASYGWKGMWLDAAREAGVAPGPATGAMFTFYRLTLVVQPFVLAGLLSASDSLAVILLGLFCGLCAFLFWRSCRKRDGRG
jgi:hypothetical protein